MADLLVLRVFCEDRRHESFARALVERLMRELNLEVDFLPVSARGGAPRALGELKAYLRRLKIGHFGQRADLLLVLIDANSAGHRAKSSEIAKAIGEVDAGVECVIGCPDPHIERWLMADPNAFRQAVGVDPPSDPGRREKDLYKRLLHEAIREAGYPVAGQMDFSSEIIERMDLYAAGKRQPSLGQLCDDLRAALQRLRPS